jgi:phosphohistidine phosphatase
MQLILWRHAEAEDGAGKPDTERNLTKKGRKQAERMAEWLRGRIGKEWRVLVSPAQRTLQTVEPLGFAHEEEDGVGLAATVKTVLRASNWPDSKRDVVVVGHQPTLGEVAAELLGTDDGISIKKGAVWWFVTRDRDGHDETVLQSVVSPDQLE